ncbi:DUF732 domain-containing protein [Mycolicibacterium peregrinum]|uniref:DUF732 domain-containing protein n=1 Tax=Mycolicibacterium peregrinum TaxID=43304 RepID=UPI0012FFB2BE|nr:DUF732 domain-containing protein [Mycolicibacterium peregrinum]
MRKIWVAVAAASLAAVLVPAPARAASDDETFLTALGAWGVHYTSADNAVSQGRRMCAESRTGATWDRLVDEVAADPAFTQERMYAEAFVRNALGIYCPAELWSTDW